MDRIDVIYEMKDDNLNLPKYIEFSSLKQKEKSEIIEKLSFNEKTYMRKWINEIDKRNLYKRKTNCHGKKHAGNVMLFAFLIAKFENIKENINLLVESAMYHDEGRENDDDIRHGLKSAIIAQDSLKDKYSSSDLRIISATISFHDERTNGFDIKKNEEIGFNNVSSYFNLTKNEKEKARVIGNILKDADALDRTRFESEYILDERYLRTKSAKTLMKLAYYLNRNYLEK